MQLSSSAFSNGSGIPPRFTCDGDDLSPPLDWEAAPAAAGSFVLLCDDPDAPAGKWHHWAVYDIHADQTGLAGRHRYHFRLLALSVKRLSLGTKPSCREVEREARRHVIAETTLVGIYQR
jgi:phosphatidylethanolamine-binding protein (PEBP) family uncharacterized protein